MYIKCASMKLYFFNSCKERDFRLYSEILRDHFYIILNTDIFCGTLFGYLIFLDIYTIYRSITSIFIVMLNPILNIL